MTPVTDRILLIEDDVELGGRVRDRLVRDGFEVLWWQEGRRLVPGELPPVQLVILDLMLPGAYGLDILKDLRAAASEVPVLVLSARNDSADKIRALKLGADDYMTKPFWPDELTERVRARMRRPTLLRTDVLDVGVVRLDVAAQQVAVAGAPVELTAMEFAFVLALARRPGMPVSRAWLAEHVLADERDAAQRTLDVHVSRIRKKLGRADLIETVFGVGYKLMRRDP